MEMLGNGLDKVVKLYVPSTYNVTEELDKETRKVYIDYVLEQFSELFGGATAQESIGAWKTSDGKVVTEDITIVFSYTNELNESILDKVISIAKKLKTELKQESISIEIVNNSSLHFI